MWSLAISVVFGLLSKFGVSIAEIFGGPIIGIILGNLQKYWKYVILGLSVLLNFGLAWGWSSSHQALTKEKAAHQLDINNFKSAQALANKNAQAEALSLKKAGQDAASKADKSYSTLLSRYHSSLLRYGANQSGSGKAGNSELQSTQSGTGPSSSTDLPPTITITGSDAQICAVNTARLQSVHDWAVELNKDIPQ